MDNTLQISLSRQTALARQLDVIANNLANVRTAGYKAEEVIFHEYLMPVARDNRVVGRDRMLSYVVDQALDRDFSAGRFQQTNNPLDVAINGEGWFVVDTEHGERYTRAGEFSLNASGELVTPRGERVLGQGGPVSFGPEEHDIQFASDGTISSSAGQKGKLRLVTFDNLRTLKKEGDNLFTTEEAPLPATESRLVQGMIEGSNVVAVKQIGDLINVTRAYVSTAKLIDKNQKLRSEAIRALADVPR